MYNGNGFACYCYGTPLLPTAIGFGTNSSVALWRQFRFCGFCLFVDVVTTRSSESWAAAHIMWILKQEANYKWWKRIHHSTRKPGGGQVLSVKADLLTGTKEFTTKEGVFNRVSAALSECFCLAFTAPSCSGLLFDDIGFVGDTAAVQQSWEEHMSSLPGRTQRLNCSWKRQRQRLPRCHERRSLLTSQKP